MSEIQLGADNFNKEVLQSDLPVLVDFWAPWCGPCQMIGPVVAELAEELDGRVKVGKVNVDEEPELAARYRVESIPTVVLIQDGRETDRLLGYRPKEDLMELLS